MIHFNCMRTKNVLKFLQEQIPNITYLCRRKYPLPPLTLGGRQQSQMRTLGYTIKKSYNHTLRQVQLEITYPTPW